MTAPSKVTVWYDSACPLCTKEIAVMRKLDWRRRIAFIDAVDPESSCPIDRTQILARFHARENGRLLSGAAAFAAMWRAIPLLWPLGMVARIAFVGQLLERAYLSFLKIRPWLQKRLQ